MNKDELTINKELFYIAYLSRFNNKYKNDYKTEEQINILKNTLKALDDLDYLFIEILKEAAYMGIDVQTMGVNIDYSYYKKDDYKILDDILLIQFKVFIMNTYTDYDGRKFSLDKFSPFYIVSYREFTKLLQARDYNKLEIDFKELGYSGNHFLDFTLEFPPKNKELQRIRAKER